MFYEKIQENEKVLTELDSFMGGDGNRGENMLRSMTAVVNEVEPREFESTVDLFKNTIMLLLTKVGGVSGTLYGSAFFRIAHAEKKIVRFTKILKKV
ncbi:DAK2 domain-containing protein [Streptococcus equinus]|uniref:DAK2 domain-containing protein n=1 Tax=Streptococcus equinus TaxID=1335 RepID=UPI000DFD2667|nr:DAK2 domain-containing protein [Streptococcus equinus]SUO80033.1 Phospho-enol-pyruvate-dihydroxy-acetone-phospho transferase, ADP-binding subunit DhaL [Streptococcus equinus]